MEFFDRCDAIIQSMPELAPEFFNIRTKGEGIQKIHPRPVQLDYQANRKRRHVICKARQLGFSTWKELEGLLLLLTVKGFSGAIISHEQKATERLMDMVILAYEMMPDKRRYPMKHEGRQELVTPAPPKGTGARLYIGTAGARTFGRGDMVHWAHCSEVAHWEDAEKIMLGLGQAVPGGGFITVESSPYGRTGWFYDQYDRARNDQGTYQALFYPWFWSADEYRRPVANGLVPTEEELNVMEAAARRGFSLSFENLQWRRDQIADWGKPFFAQEYAEDDETCFLVSGNPRFDPAFIQTLINTAEARPLMEDRFIPGGKVKVWLRPGVGHHYVIAADPSKGLPRRDPCAACVLDVDSGQHVATLKGHIAPHDFAGYLVKLAKEYNDAMIAPEAEHGAGEALISFLVHTLEYPNLYQRERVVHPFVDDPGLAKAVGWLTTQKSKHVLCSEFIRSLECGDFKTWDTELLGQAFNILVDSNGQVYTAQNKEDDVLMSAMIANVCADQAADVMVGGGPRVASYI